MDIPLNSENNLSSSPEDNENIMVDPVTYLKRDQEKRNGISTNGNAKFDGKSTNILPNEHSNNGNGVYNPSAAATKSSIINGEISLPDDFGGIAYTFKIDVPQNVVVTVHNIIDQPVEKLVDEIKSPGNYRVTLQYHKIYWLGTACYKLWVRVPDDEIGTEEDQYEYFDNKKYKLVEKKFVKVEN